MENCSLKSTHNTRRYENCSLKSTQNTRRYENCSLKTRIIPGGIKTVLCKTHTIPGGVNISFEHSSGEGGILGAWCYTRQVGQRRSLTESRPSPGDSREESSEEAILESWCYTRRNGAASIQVESRPIPGNSRWCSAWLSSKEGGDVSFYTSGQQAAVV